MTTRKLISRRRALQGFASVPITRSTSSTAQSFPRRTQEETVDFVNEARNTGALVGDEVVEPGIFEIAVDPDSIHLQTVELRIL